MRDQARWLYRTLEAEYENESSDGVVDDAIHSNEWPGHPGGRHVLRGVKRNKNHRAKRARWGQQAARRGRADRERLK